MLRVDLFTDPACPFAFSAEPVRWALRWHYGDALRWVPRMIVLTREAGEAERLAGGAPGLQRAHGMPIAPTPYPRPASSEPACRLVVAARLHAQHGCERLLRELRVRTMAGGLLDDPALLRAALVVAGLDPVRLEAWAAGGDVDVALEEDVRAARAPSAAARVLDHKLGGPAGARRLSAPTYLFTDADRREVVVPGFNPLLTYDVAIANLAPGIERRAAPESAAELLTWAGEPLATAEVTAVLGVSGQQARAALAKVATPRAAGADLYWSLG